MPSKLFQFHISSFTHSCAPSNSNSHCFNTALLHYSAQLWLMSTLQTFANGFWYFEGTTPVRPIFILSHCCHHSIVISAIANLCLLHDCREEQIVNYFPVMSVCCDTCHLWRHLLSGIVQSNLNCSDHCVNFCQHWATTHIAQSFIEVILFDKTQPWFIEDSRKISFIIGKDPTRGYDQSSIKLCKMSRRRYLRCLKSWRCKVKLCWNVNECC